MLCCYSARGGCTASVCVVQGGQGRSGGDGQEVTGGRGGGVGGQGGGQQGKLRDGVQGKAGMPSRRHPPRIARGLLT